MGNKTLLLTNKDTCEQKEITVEEFQKQYPNFTDKVLNMFIEKGFVFDNWFIDILPEVNNLDFDFDFNF